MWNFLFSKSDRDADKESHEKERADKVFRSGFIVQGDASRYKPTEIADEVIEHVDMIPVTFAESKIHELHTDLLTLKTRYDKHVFELNASHLSNVQQLKKYYEQEMNVLKQKALRHAEVLKELNQFNDNAIRKELRSKENEAEELRDVNFAERKQHNDELKSLESVLEDTKRERDEYKAELDSLAQEREEMKREIEHEKETIAALEVVANKPVPISPAEMKIAMDIISGLEGRVEELTASLLVQKEMNMTANETLQHEKDAYAALEADTTEALQRERDAFAALESEHARQAQENEEMMLTIERTNSQRSTLSGSETVAGSNITSNKLDPEIQKLQKELISEECKLKDIDEKFKEIKDEIKQWNDDFEAENSREAGKSEKEVIKPIYLSYKKLNHDHDETEAHIEELQLKLKSLNERRAASASSGVDQENDDMVAGEMTEVEVEVVEKVVEKVTLQMSEEEVEMMNSLRETVETLSQRLAETTKTLEETSKSLEEAQSAAALVSPEALAKKEIASNILKTGSNFEGSPEQHIEILEDALADAKADSATLQGKLKEVNLEHKKLNDSYSAVVAASTSSSDENASKVTEQLVKIKQLEERIGELTKSLKEASDEVADMHLAEIDDLAAAANGEEEANQAIQAKEFAECKAALDSAHEEVAKLMDRTEGLETLLDIANEKASVYKELIDHLEEAAAEHAEESSRLATKAATAAANSGSSGSGLDDLVVKAKKKVSEGTALWKSQKRVECFDMYKSFVEDAIQILKSPKIVNPLKDAIKVASKADSGPDKARAAVGLRKAVDFLISDASNFAEEENQLNASNNPVDSENKGADMNRKQIGDREDIVALKGRVKELDQDQIDASDAARESEAALFADNTGDGDGNDDNKPPDSSEIGDKSSDVGADMTAPLPSKIAAIARELQKKELSAAKQAASLLKRAQNAEKQVERLKVALRDALKDDKSKSNGKGMGADAVEMRRLQRKVKDLETQATRSRLSGATTSSGGKQVDESALKAAKVALLSSEKKYKKQIKDIEASSKKEISDLSRKLQSITKQLEKETASSGGTQKELETLRAKAKELKELSKEVESLRVAAGDAVTLSADLKMTKKELDTTSTALKRETTLRKKYKNELEDIKGSIRVYARCRPFAQYEKDRDCGQCVSFVDETQLRVTSSRGEKEFEFDAAFDMESTQDQVFEDTKRLVESCLDGYNVCLFAYGQTGSGKTFTMTGSPSMPGLTPKAINELFSLISEKKTCTVTVKTYFVELYNDQLVDLYWILDQKKTKTKESPPKLEIKLNANKMVELQGVVIKDANTPEELMDMFMTGNTMRHTGATKMNAESSRSHSLFSILIQSYDKTSKKTNIGKLTLVDLAGSERADKTGAEAERLTEAMSINKSLSALGDVISALSDGAKFIPYRNNKLTQVMQDSLGGTAKTLMFVNFSPADYNSDETVSSLAYAARVKKITNNVSKSAETEEVTRLKKIIAKLQAGEAADDDAPSSPRA
jgi:hypothetical protein